MSQDGNTFISLLPFLIFYLHDQILKYAPYHYVSLHLEQIGVIFVTFHNMVNFRRQYSAFHQKKVKFDFLICNRIFEHR